MSEKSNVEFGFQILTVTEKFARHYWPNVLKPEYENASSKRGEKDKKRMHLRKTFSFATAVKLRP